MKTIRLITLCVSVSVSAGSVLIARDLPDVNRQQMLADLEKMQKDRQQKWEMGIKNVIAEISTAAGSPQTAARLYQEALKATQAGETSAKKGVSRRQQMQQQVQEDVTGSPTFRTGMQYRLRFLTMLLQLSAGEEVATVFPEVERYVTGILGDKKLMEDQASKQVWGAAFNERDPIVQMFRIEPYIKEGKGLGMSPGAVEHIIDGVLMPQYREKKDPKLIELWDGRIDRKREQVDEGGLNMEKDRFATEEMPQLLWSRASDFAAIDEPNRAISEMFALIRQHPGHPDFEQWVEDLKGRLAK